MLLTDPRALDEEQIASAIEREGRFPRIQFSRPEACVPDILAHVNACCRRFGANVSVRFFGHNQRELDLRVLEQLPELRALVIDVHKAANLESLGSLAHMEQLAFGVFESDYPKLLEMANLRSLRTLTLIPSCKNNVDLAPLAAFGNLEDLTLCGHARNLDVLAQIGTIRKLGLSCMRSNVPLDPVRSMTGLDTLWMVLGGRANTEEFANLRVKNLRIDRVRGLEHIDLSGFPHVVQLCLEDQIKIAVLDLRPLAHSLQRLQIFNLKNLQELRGIEEQTRLETVWLGQTKVDPDELIGRWPKCVQAIGLAGYGKKRADKLREEIKSRGFNEAKYVGMLGM